ncbi:MAG: DUF1624 domain-containing protein [Actinomycetota bacterium]|nr:DUF1624 domain-containing protein [Actinomycetota bacterium]
MVLAFPLLGARYANLILGLAVVAAGVYVGADRPVMGGAAGVLLAPLGVVPEGLFMPDYRPLLPWFGVVLLLGLFFGSAAYLPRRKNPSGAPSRSPLGNPPPYAAPLAFLGRHTLAVYLVHQPVLVAALWALGVIRF